MSKAVIVDSDIVTPFGLGIEKCWTNLCEGHSAIKPVDRFDVSSFGCSVAATIEGLTYHKDFSLVWQMLTQLSPKAIPNDAALLLATTTGEVDILEQAILEDNKQCSESQLSELLKKVYDLYGLQGKASVVSSACTSSTAAIGLAAASIESENEDAVLIVTCDAVTEFVFTGFSSLMALDPEGARPFDAERQGLSLGEAAGYMLLMSEDRARREHRSILGYVLGWGLSNDANHMTGPARDGDGLARAIRLAFNNAEIDSDSIGFICAHGTGTRYNDAMEMQAFKQVFSQPHCTFSVKGALGHTLGVAGLLETALTLQFLKMKTIPPSSRINKIDDDAKGWIVTNKKSHDCQVALTTNSGFGGVNAALVISR
ncbi:MAG: hypothetical protein JXA96_16375 [Sedimentisphaerales bacterium]|nr:hypothetical protein [Sedimentisphaerales bacterium]